MTDPLKPTTTLLIKLGSALVHAEEAFEMLDRKDHVALLFDRGAFETVATDPEVVEWIVQMSRMAFLPVKR